MTGVGGVEGLVRSFFNKFGMSKRFYEVGVAEIVIGFC